jgi:hypothetical protein
VGEEGEGDGADGVLLVVVELVDAADLEADGAGLEGVGEGVEVEVGQPVDGGAGDEDAGVAAQGDAVAVEVQGDAAVAWDGDPQGTPGGVAAEDQQGVLADPGRVAGGPEGVGVVLEEAAQGLFDDAVEEGAGGGAGLEVGGERTQADTQAVEVDVKAGEVGGDGAAEGDVDGLAGELEVDGAARVGGDPEVAEAGDRALVDDRAGDGRRGRGWRRGSGPGERGSG